MVILSAAGAIVFYCLSLLRGLLAVREKRTLKRRNDFAAAAGLFAAGSAFLAYYVSAGPLKSSAGSHHDVGPLAVVGVGLSVLGAATCLGLGLSSRHARKAAARTGAAAPDGSGRRSWKERLAFLRDLSSPHWKDMEGRRFMREDSLSSSKWGRAITLGVAGITVPATLLIIGTSIVVNVRGSAASDVAAQTLGYFTLLIATSWTVVYLLTLLLIAVQQSWRGHGAELSVADVVVTVGTWAGLGAAGGVFVGALIPVVVVGIPKGILAPLDDALLGTVSPQLLLNVSASGAIAGFLVGLVVSLTDFASGEDSLLVSTVMPPLAFGTLTTLFGFLGLRPGAMSKKLATDYMDDSAVKPLTGIDPFATPNTLDLSSQEGFASLVLAFDSRGWNEFLDHRVYFTLTWLVVVLVVIFGFSIRLNHRERYLLRADEASAGGGDSEDSAQKQSPNSADSKASG